MEQQLENVAGAGGPPVVLSGAFTATTYAYIVANGASTLSALTKTDGVNADVDVFADNGYSGVTFENGAVIPAGDGFRINSGTVATGSFLGYPHKAL